MDTIYFHDGQGRETGRLHADPDTLALNAQHATEPFVYGDYIDAEVYVDGATARPRPSQSTKLIGQTLTNLPVPCTITINDTEYPCNDTSAELAFDYPGKYRIVVRAWPHLDKEFEIENPAP